MGGGGSTLKIHPLHMQHIADDVEDEDQYGTTYLENQYDVKYAKLMMRLESSKQFWPEKSFTNNGEGYKIPVDIGCELTADDFDPESSGLHRTHDRHWIAHLYKRKPAKITDGAPTCKAGYALRIKDITFGQKRLLVSMVMINDIWISQDSAYIGKVATITHGPIVADPDTSDSDEDEDEDEVKTIIVEICKGSYTVKKDTQLEGIFYRLVSKD